MAFTNDTFASRGRKKLLRVGKKGLPKVYGNIGQWLIDFWPDLPWNPKEFVEVLELIQGSEDWEEICTLWRKRYSIDMNNLFSLARKEAEEAM
jgi:hypothetical protein